jgi:DNA-binding beta-propeller fold protein YncE
MFNVRRRSSLILTLFVVPAVLPACDSGESPASPIPSGPAPSVEFSAPFGEPPLTGNIQISPLSTTQRWRYRVEFPGAIVREGPIESAVTIPYNLEAVGSHRFRVELIGPGEPVVFEKRLIVTDPASDFEVLDLVPVEEIWPDAASLSPEGIVLDPYGIYLYVANYHTGEVVRVDAGNLEPSVEGRFHLGPGVEGLALTPSSMRLLGIHKHDRLSVAWLPDPVLSWELSGLEGSFVRVIDESHALVGGVPLAIVNLDQRTIEQESTVFQPGHFVIDRSRGRVIASNLSDGTIDILGFPSLAGIRSIPLDGLHPTHVALHPHEDKVYALTRDAGGQGWLLVLDPMTGTRLAATPVGPVACGGYCVANPVAEFGGGRYVAFEQSSSVLVVDTDSDELRYRFGTPLLDVVGGPAGVAALPDSDVLYVLGGPYAALTKIRLRGPAGS